LHPTLHGYQRCEANHPLVSEARQADEGAPILMPIFGLG